MDVPFPVLDVLEAVERPALHFDLRPQRAAVETHVGEVLEQDVVGLVRRALELLAGQRCPVPPGEGVDLVFGEVELPADRSSWRVVLRARSISTRAALRRHPWAITLMESRMAPGPANLRSHEDTITVLLESGCSATTATHAYNLVDSYVLGFALQEVNLPFSNAEELAAIGEQLLAQVPADQYPNLVRVSAELLGSGFDYGNEFEFGLDLILDGIERVLQGA